MILAVTSNRFAVSWKLLSAEVNNKIACVSVLENAPTIGRRFMSSIVTRKRLLQVYIRNVKRV